MRPILVRILGLGLPAYGTMLVLSFVAAIILVTRAAKRYRVPSAVITDLAFWVMVGVIIGGRVLYVLFHLNEYYDLLSIFEIWRGGMMFFGSFIGAVVAGILYVRKTKVPALLLADLVAPSIALGEFFTRIGCFLNGCCFGYPTDLPWGVLFPADSFAGQSAVGGHHLHPTQLYSSFFGLLLFAYLLVRGRYRHYRGEMFAQYLIISGGYRFAIDFIRYYENPANLWINQLISLAVIIAGIILLLGCRKRKIEDKPTAAVAVKK